MKNKLALLLVNLAALPILIPLTSMSILVGHFLHPIKYFKNIKAVALEAYNNSKDNNIILRVIAVSICALEFALIDFIFMPLIGVPLNLCESQIRDFGDDIQGKNIQYTDSITQTVKKNFSDAVLGIKGNSLFLDKKYGFLLQEPKISSQDNTNSL